MFVIANIDCTYDMYRPNFVSTKTETMSSRTKTETISTRSQKLQTAPTAASRRDFTLTAKTLPVLLAGFLSITLIGLAMLKGGAMYPQLYIAGSIVLALLFLRFTDPGLRNK